MIKNFPSPSLTLTLGIASLFVSSLVFAAPKQNPHEKKQEHAKPQQQAEAKDTKEKSQGSKSTTSLLDVKPTKDPTFITADSLSMNTQQHTFTYTGNVQVKQGDMTLSSDILEGLYGEDNKIKQLVARKNVVITKGADIKATSQKATYLADQDLVTLTDNPELTQGQSILTADIVKVLLRENRSMAEGQVKMKVIKEEGGSISGLIPKDNKEKKGEEAKVSPTPDK